MGARSSMTGPAVGEEHSKVRGGSRTCEKGVLCSPDLAIAAQTSRGGAALLLSMLTVGMGRISVVGQIVANVWRGHDQAGNEPV